jgi:predicted phosphodiesterase
MTLEMYEYFCDKMCHTRNVVGRIFGNFWDFVYRNKINLENFMEEMRKNPQDRLNEKLEFRGEEKKEIDIINDFAVSKGKSLLLGMKSDERLIFGHTHVPFINKERTVVNTGSWVDELKSKQYQNSYVKISDGIMELKFFNREI